MLSIVFATEMKLLYTFCSELMFTNLFSLVLFGQYHRTRLDMRMRTMILYRAGIKAMLCSFLTLQFLP